MLESEFELRGWRWPVTSLAVLACLCALGPIVFDLEQGLPLSLQSLLVCWLPLMLGWRAGVAGVLGYLVLGFSGLPVFAGYRGGMDILMGPTAGYLLGMPVAALALGAMANATPESATDRERYLRHVNKYASGKARSKVGNAVRRGVAAHEYKDDVDGSWTRSHIAVCHSSLWIAMGFHAL